MSVHGYLSFHIYVCLVFGEHSETNIIPVGFALIHLDLHAIVAGFNKQ